MATSTCLKCGSSRFESKKFEPKNSTYTLIAHQCADCGGVVGVTEFINTAVVVANVENRVKKVEADAAHVRSRVDWMIANRR